MTKEIDNGGPAFPCKVVDHYKPSIPVYGGPTEAVAVMREHGGMTLRQYAAIRYANALMEGRE